MSEEDGDVLTKLTLSSFVLFFKTSLFLLLNLFFWVLSVCPFLQTLYTPSQHNQSSHTFQTFLWVSWFCTGNIFLSFSILFNPFTVCFHNLFFLCDWFLRFLIDNIFLMPTLLCLSNSLDRIGCRENTEIYSKFSLLLIIIYLEFIIWNHIGMSYRLCTAFNCKKTAVCG